MMGMSGVLPILAQVGLVESATVIPSRFSLSVLSWLATYVVLLVAWSVTSTRTTMHARVTFGRSRLVRWVSAIAGLMVFVVVPMTWPRLLLPSGAILALAPVVYTIYGVYRKGGVTLMRAIRVGTGSAAVVAGVSIFRMLTFAADMLWTALQALIRLDWNSLRNLPEMTRRAGERVQQIVAPDSSRVVTLLRDSGAPLDPEADPRLKGIPKSVLARLVSLLNESMAIGASDTILMIREQGPTETRFHIDGVAHKGPAVSGEEGALVARTIKLLAGVMGSGKTTATTSAFPVMYQGRRSDVFVETASSNSVETISLRHTARERSLIEAGLANLGMDDAAVAAVRDLLRQQSGLLLFVGRPDSGKSTTLYAAITELGLLGRSVALVEPSMRHRVEHIAQISAGNGGAMAFPAAIQAALQHHPDVLVVRDMMDRPTAEACLREAAAGRLVLAGVVGDDAFDAVQRLRAIGVESGMIRVGLQGIVSQRLTRVLCETCKAEYQPTPELAAKLGLPKTGSLHVYRSVGCGKCRGTGFIGRTGLFELLTANESMKEALATNESPENTKKVMRAASLRSLRQSAVAKICQGVTSVEEVVRVLK
jgi:general secretion pathway protein E